MSNEEGAYITSFRVLSFSFYYEVLDLVESWKILDSCFLSSLDWQTCCNLQLFASVAQKSGVYLFKCLDNIGIYTFF